jgi:hypothetical protein
MVLQDEDEFEVPSLKRNLVVVESAGGQQSSQQKSSNFTSESSSFNQPTEALFVEKDDIYAAFVPRQEYAVGESPLELYLINDTNHILLYSFYDQKGSKMEGQTAGNLDPKSKILLKEYDLKDLGELSNCFFQILFYQLGETDIRKPLERNLKIQAVKFYKSSSYKDNPYFHQNAILHKLTGEILEHKLDELSQKDFNKAIAEKEKFNKPIAQSTESNIKIDIVEVDLHINALIDSVTGLSNADILEFQMNKFHEIMQMHQNSKGQKIVFIHGIGNGTLKKKVHDELRRKYKKHYQQDASFKEYGWGATMVTIR